MRLLEPFVCSLGDNNDELRTIWQTRRCSLTKTAYLSSRFGGLALAIFGAFPSISPPMTITINGLAFFVCVVSNGLFAIRVWALWLQSHRINHSINYSSGTNDIFPTAGSTSPLPTRHDHWPEASLLFIAPFIACIVHNIGKYALGTLTGLPVHVTILSHNLFDVRGHLKMEARRSKRHSLSSSECYMDR
ncbi:hypothetical protein HGRIS_004497 [Hohenbuehelia grisea]|uniref:Uncharacterized protein n=1 Tax=Hohenbuehelia grisea TaxID=104357 RepID=A0ABR3JDQ3_9AGAR